MEMFLSERVKNKNKNPSKKLKKLQNLEIIEKGRKIQKMTLFLIEIGLSASNQEIWNKKL